LVFFLDKKENETKVTRLISVSSLALELGEREKMAASRGGDFQ
jgi:hypothetical protein